MSIVSSVMAQASKRKHLDYKANEPSIYLIVASEVGCIIVGELQLYE